MSTEQTIINAIITITQTRKYLLTLEDWHSLIFVSHGVMLAVRHHLQFGFTLDDQWVFQSVREYGQHALYHANSPYRIELTFREVGYCPDAYSCTDHDCEYPALSEIMQTPISHAIRCGLHKHLELIVKKGLSERDYDLWGLIRSAIYSFNPMMIKFIYSLPTHDEIFSVEDYMILFLASTMPDDIVNQCIDFVISTGIDVNSKNGSESNILFMGTNSKRALKRLKYHGIDISARNSDNENIVDRCINFANMHVIFADSETLRESRKELVTLSKFEEFAGDRENISAAISRIDNILTLMGETI